MKMPACRLVLLVSVLALGALPALADNVEMRVSVKSVGTEKKGSTRISNRILVVRIDNRERHAFENLELEWKVAGRDLKTRKTTVVASGTESVDLPAEEEVEVETKQFSFSKTEGKVSREGRGQNQRLKVEDDTGVRYSGYAVVLKQNGKVIAEASTPGVD
jgi:hypothetical protein